MGADLEKKNIALKLSWIVFLLKRNVVGCSFSYASSMAGYKGRLVPCRVCIITDSMHKKINKSALN